MRVKRWEKIAIVVTAVLAVTVLYIRMAAPELLGIPSSPEGDREPLPISLGTVVYNNLEERLGLTPDEMEGKSPEEIDKLGDEFKNMVSLFSQNTIVAAHEWLDRYFWPKDESKVISLEQLKQEIAKLELKWESAAAEIEEFNVLPVVEAYINDVNKAFEEVKKSSWINRKPLVTAHNILHDLSVLWAEGTNPPPYGVTSTEEILRGTTVEFYSGSNIYAIPDHNLVNSLPKEQHPIANRTAQLPGFTYDEENDRYVHEETGIWYVIKDGKRVLPAEQYIDPKYEIYYINIEPRTDDAWVHVSNTEIIVQPGDTLGRIDEARISTLKEGLYYRMNPTRYFIGGNSFFLETELDDPSQISPGQVLVYRNYVDRDAPEEFHEHAKSMGGRYYVAQNGTLTPVEEKEETIAEADLEIISLVRQSMNDALDGGRIPGMAEGSGVLNTRVPGVERLVAKVETPKLKADLERLLDNLVRGAELIRQGQGRDGREYWVEAHKIAHDLDWKLLGNEP